MYCTQSVISGFLGDVDEVWAFLRYYAAKIGNSVPTFGDNISVPVLDSLTLEDGTERSCRNVCTEMLFHAA